ncbi:MAG TPA: anti-sigma factor [Acidimicrobiales bacterium]|nr:anti-sigma factor [Acidimicrobiales bacterium]
MERLTTHEELQELLGAYALDAVDADEAAAIERHLPTCPRCRNELTDHREVAAMLGDAGAPAPSGLWDRIVAGLEEPPPELRLTRAPSYGDPSWASRFAAAEPTAAPTGTVGWPAIAARTPEVAPVLPLDTRRRRRSVPMRFMVAMGTAAAVIVALLGVEIGRLQVHKSPPATGNLAMLAYQVADANPQAHHVVLTSPDGAYTVKAVIVPDGLTYIGPGNLATLPADQTYQMWGVVNGARISLGVIGDTPTYAAFTTPPVATVLAMTVEERGGVVSSTKTPVVTAVVSG